MESFFFSSWFRFFLGKRFKIVNGMSWFLPYLSRSSVFIYNPFFLTKRKLVWFFNTVWSGAHTKLSWFLFPFFSSQHVPHFFVVFPISVHNKNLYCLIKKRFFQLPSFLIRGEHEKWNGLSKENFFLFYSPNFLITLVFLLFTGFR